MKSYLAQKRLEILRILCLATRSQVVVGKYLDIFHLEEGESTVLLRTNWKMLLTHSPVDNLWSISEIVEWEEGLSHRSCY